MRKSRDYIGALTALCNSESWDHMDSLTQELCTAVLLKYSGQEEFEALDIIALNNHRVRFYVDSPTQQFTAFLATWAVS